MVPGLTTIIIPSYNHASILGEAISSALLQTAPVEVLVIDDGSTDATAEVLRSYIGKIRAITIPHCGPSIARNVGINAASGEFVCFLDADDLIAPDKIEKQLAEFAASPDSGWVLCDVRIEDASKGRIANASAQYEYQHKALDGWIERELLSGPFIPIMSPLIRREALGDDVRFSDAMVPEDYHFWLALSKKARVRYVPIVLATYRHGKTGRSRLPKTAREVEKNVVLPLRLNLGCGTKGTASWHPMPGMVNLDRSMGWRFEDGLKDFADHSVAGITISHALMYVHEAEWPPFFSEVSRVLIDGGVVRVTEDDAMNPLSSRLGGWKGSEPAITLTSPEFVIRMMQRSGLAAREVSVNESDFVDMSLVQAQHGAWPDVFFVEGRKLPGTFFAPHNDDEALFGAFTILKYRPRVVVCYASPPHYGDARVRERESREAVTILGGGEFEQWAGGDLVAQMREFRDRVHPVRVWAPHPQASHPEHVAVSQAAREVFEEVVFYHTYDEAGKVRAGEVVEFEVGWIETKHRALLRYESQIKHPRAHQFFAWDLLEYKEAP